MTTQYQTNHDYKGYPQDHNTNSQYMTTQMNINYPLSGQQQYVKEQQNRFSIGTTDIIQASNEAQCFDLESNQSNEYQSIQQCTQSTITQLQNHYSLNTADTLSSSLSIGQHYQQDGGSSNVKVEDKRKHSDSTQSECMDQDQEMGGLDEDYTTSSYQYPEYDEEAEKIEEEENQQTISRLNEQQSFVFSMEANDSNHMQFSQIPVNKILNVVTECYMYGDIILEPKYSNYDEKAINSFCNWKYINQAIKRNNFIKIVANNKGKCYEDFNQVSKLYNSYQNKDIYRMSSLLDKFGKIYNFIKQGLAKTADFIDIFQKYEALQKRSALFEELSDQYLQKIPSDKLFFAVKIQPNFSDLQLENQSICFSSALLKLVNMPEDKFINLILRNSAPEFFGWQLRLMYLRNKLNRYLRIPEGDSLEDGDILTRDGLRIPAKIRKEFVAFNVDQLTPEIPIAPFEESLVVYYFDIDSKTMEQIEYMRNNYVIEELENPQEVDFYTYSLETQAFLELYYSQVGSSLSQKKKLVKKVSNASQ